MLRESIKLGKPLKNLTRFIAEQYRNPRHISQSKKRLDAIVSDCKGEITQNLKSCSLIHEVMLYKHMIEYILDEVRKSIGSEAELLTTIEEVQPMFQFLTEPVYKKMISKDTTFVRRLETAFDMVRIDRFIAAALQDLQVDLETQCKGAARQLVSTIRRAPLDEGVEYSWKYLFLNLLIPDGPIETQENLKREEERMRFEDWAFRNFSKEIEENFLGLNSDAAKQYLINLSELMEEKEAEVTSIDSETPPVNSPLWFAGCQILERRMEQRQGFFREMKQQFLELHELQEKTRFTYNLQECMPKTTREKYILMWEMGELTEKTLPTLALTLTDSEQKELRGLLRILKNPDLWGTAEYEAIYRMRELKKRKSLYKKKSVSSLTLNN